MSVTKRILGSITAAAILACCLFSCSSEQISEDERLYRSLFDLNNKIEVKIDISDGELAKMQQDYEKYSSMNSKSPIYRMADKVTIKIGDEEHEIDEVGVRMKGNLSLTDFYDTKKNEMYNLIHLKLSFDETFDDEEHYGADAKKWDSTEERDARKKRTFATLNGIDLKWNKNYDNTYLREYYVHQMFRENGVISPNMNLAATTVGKNYCGVFSIYEQVDGNFIERNFPEEDWGGDLYKAAWTMKPANYKTTVTYGIEDEDKGEKYNFDLKTNKKSSKHESLENLLSVINDPDVTKDKFDEVVDSDSFINFAALTYFAGDPDDMRNNYNNHYVYFRKSDGKAVFIPYDDDRVLGICVGWNPTGSAMTTISPFSPMSVGNKSEQVNPLYRLTILDDDCYYLDEYTEKIKELSKSDWLTEEKFKTYFDKAEQNYSDVTKPDAVFENADNDRFVFGMDDGEFSGGDKSNMSVGDYFSQLLETVNEDLSDAASSPQS